MIASRYENMNYTLLEAMSCGSTVVSTNVGGPAEVVRDGVTGLLAPPDDPAALANACRRLLADRPWARRLGLAARDEIASRFSPAAIVREWEVFIATVMQTRRSAGG